MPVWICKASSTLHNPLRISTSPEPPGADGRVPGYRETEEYGKPRREMTDGVRSGRTRRPVTPHHFIPILVIVSHSDARRRSDLVWN